MFEPKKGMFFVGSEAIFPCNWKNDWFIWKSSMRGFLYINFKNPYKIYGDSIH